MLDISQKSEKSQNKSYLSFSILDSRVLRSVRIYQLTITEYPMNQVYSFYFRYNTLKSLHEYASSKENSIYPKCNFPKKLCFSHRKNDRKEEFINNFFHNFLSKINETLNFNSQINEKITNISIFLELFDLNTSFLENDFQEFSKNFDIKIENPFEIGEEVRTFEEMRQHIVRPSNFKQSQFMFSLKINGKIFEFYEHEKLGKGGYGQVYKYSLGEENDDNLLFAVKFIEFTKDENERKKIMNSILSESQLLTELDHENVVKGYFYFKLRLNSIDYFCHFMEFCNGNTLENYILEKKAKKEYIEEKEIRKIFVEILKGMQYARNFFLSKHSELFMHRDLKPDNILFHKLGNKTFIKIADFGLAKTYFKSQKPVVSLESSKDYQSPQMAFGGKLCDKCDIWSLGVILYYMFFNEFPWPKKDNSIKTYNTQRELLENKELQFKNKNRTISKEMQILLKEMIRFDENKRISFDQLFQNNMFKNELKSNHFEQVEKNNKKDVAQSDKRFEKDIKKRNFNLDILRGDQTVKSVINNKKIDEKFYNHLIGLHGFFEKPAKKLLKIEELKIDENIPFLESFEENPEIVEEEKKFDDPGLSHDTNQEIKKILKKEKIKINFLTFLDYKIKDFSDKHQEIQMPKLTIFRFYLQKLKIAIILKMIKNLDYKPENGGIWYNNTQLKVFLSLNQNTRKEFLDFLKDATIKYQILQDLVLQEIIKCEVNHTEFNGKNLEINEILEFLNPYIKDFKIFLVEFSHILLPIIVNLSNYIQNIILSKANDFERISVENKNKYREIVMIYKNLCVLVNLPKILNLMNEEQIISFDPNKDFEKNDKVDYRKMVKKLGF